MKIIGHRGARGLAPENTIATFAKAIETGVDMIEFDLRVSLDSVVVLHHDPDIQTGARNAKVIANSTYKELKKTKNDLATLEEATEFINKRVPLYIEVKPGVNVKPIVKILKKYLAKGWRESDFYLASFSQGQLLKLNEQLPGMPKVIVEKWSGVRATRRARQLDTKFLAMNHHWLWSGFIWSVSKRGYVLFTYTLNSPAKAKRWAKVGLAGVVTDYPDRFTR